MGDRSARCIHVVLSNPDTHFRSCLVQFLGAGEANQLLRRADFESAPAHGRSLNMADIGIAALKRRCLNRRIGDQHGLAGEVAT
jgi:hypothetical protein